MVLVFEKKLYKTHLFADFLLFTKTVSSNKSLYWIIHKEIWLHIIHE